MRCILSSVMLVLVVVYIAFSQSKVDCRPGVFVAEVSHEFTIQEVETGIAFI